MVKPIMIGPILGAPFIKDKATSILFDCTSLLNFLPKCGFCEGKHDMESCSKFQQNLITNANRRIQNGQVY